MALFEAYRKLDQYDDSRPSWSVAVSGLRTIDASTFCGGRWCPRLRLKTAAYGGQIPSWPATPPVLGVWVERWNKLVMGLPPKERACILLKDVFDYTLEENRGKLVGSTVGGVKAALKPGPNEIGSLA